MSLYVIERVVGLCCVYKTLGQSRNYITHIREINHRSGRTIKLTVCLVSIFYNTHAYSRYRIIDTILNLIDTTLKNC